jgi:outer membrane protein OmpA-like peptidoglycan-associated protein
LTTDPPEEIDALRSTSSLSHRARVSRRRRSRFRRTVTALVAVLVLGGGITAWQMGVFDSILSPTPDVQAALNNAGFSSIAATVDGQTVTLTGTAESEIVLSQVSAVALSVEGVQQVDNQVVIPADETGDTIEGQIQAALDEAGFSGLSISVAGDLATLTGTVRNEEELNAAALKVLNVSGVAQLDNQVEIGSASGSVDVIAALNAALSADEHAYVTAGTHDGLAVLEGAVPSEEARSGAVAAVLSVPGVDKVDNRLTIDPDLPIGPALPPEQLEAAAATALAGVGIQTVSATVEGRRAILDGTVPLETLGTGFFAFVQEAESAVLAVDGIDQVSSRLTLRGDGAVLRSELVDLLATSPVEFAVGSADLTAESTAVLDQAALIIQSQPGLQVFIAGHTDAAGSSQTNEALASERAAAALNYLLTRGVPSYRLVAVSYGELFPDLEATDEQNRRIEFEVGP